MNKSKILLPVLIIATLLTACSDDKPNSGTTEGEAKTLIVKTNIETRTLKSTFAENDEIGIYTKSSSDVSSTWYNKVTGVSKATYKSGEWSIAPPVELSEKAASVFAYYPFSAQATDPAAIPVSTVAQIDYLYAGAANTATASNATTNLSMRHAQANIRFNIAKLSYTGGAGVLQSIQMANNSGKTAFFTEGALNIATGVITGKTGANGAFTLSQINKPTAAQGWTEAIPAMMVIPFKPQAAGDVQLIVTIDNNPYTINCPALPEGYVAGKQYTIVFELSDAGLILNPEDMTVETWGDNSNTVTGKTSVFLTIITTKANQIVTMPDMGTSTGVITFGDGQEGDYTANLQHTYAQPGTYKVQVLVKSIVTVVKFSGLPEMSEIDLSKFGK